MDSNRGNAKNIEKGGITMSSFFFTLRWDYLDMSMQAKNFIMPVLFLVYGKSGALLEHFHFEKNTRLHSKTK